MTENELIERRARTLSNVLTGIVLASIAAGALGLVWLVLR